jgi:hypothetical protein
MQHAIRVPEGTSVQGVIPFQFERWESPAAFQRAEQLLEQVSTIADH